MTLKYKSNYGQGGLTLFDCLMSESTENVQVVDSVDSMVDSKGANLHYNSAGVCTLYSLLPRSFTPSARMAASRALLRRGAFQDQKHSLVRKDGGLHPSYLALHGLGGRITKQDQREIRNLLDVSLTDAFDAVSFSSPLQPSLA
jgi:hypothetical protein